MSLLARSSDTESIVGIQFGIFGPDEIRRRSVCEVTNPSTTDGKLNGLFDPRMGVLENGKVCRTCGQNNHHCPGHFGHFELARPVYYTQFFDLTMKVLRCICYKCGKLLIDRELHKGILKLRGENRWKAVVKACEDVTRCGEMTEDGCGARQPSKFKEEPVHRIFAIWSAFELPAGTGALEGYDEASKTLTMPLEPEYVQRLFRRITDEEASFMGFDPHWCRPDWFLCSVLAIPPPQVRPSVTQDNNQRAEDDLTSKLIDIIKANNILKQKIATNPTKRAIDEWTNLLQYHIATLVDNNIPGVSPAAQRSGRPLKSVQQRLGSKDGRIRSTLQGKRVEFSARSVITPDPNISVGELGVPQKIAMNLTFPDKVTAFNIAKLYKLVQNGPDVYPGAKTVQRSDGRTISLKHVNTKTLELFEGDTVHRHLMDGDPVLFNRQPSLHRMSMMCHLAKILPYNTFRLNVFTTAPYNADFDGDEMNLHAPQSVEAAIELRTIAAVPLQIVSPRESVPIVSVVQDTLVGANRFTRPGVFFTKKEAMNLLVHAKRWNGILPPPAVVDPQPMWSGHQLFSALLPPVTLKNAKNNSGEPIEIVGGEMRQGVLDKGVFSKLLLHTIYNDYGPDMTVDFLDSLQAMIASFLMNSGFSVGISDLIADKETTDQMQEAIAKLTKTVEDQILQLHTGLFENSSGRSNSEEFEAKIMATLNKAVGEAGGIGLKSLTATNRMTNMVKAGSKGSDVNVSQMIATLGQQAIEGKRVPNGFQHRTLPHFKRFDDSAAARGFISSSFIKGLQPDEMFFHAMSGREGLIDTAVKTADTGYLYRRVRVALEDLIVQHDGSVRDANGNLVQMAYGEDGINATKLESQSLPLGKFSDEKILTEYAADGAPGAAAYLQAAMADRTLLVEKVFGGKLQNNVRYPVHLERILDTLAMEFRLKANEGTVTATEALEAQATILNRTHANNKLWGALVRYYLRPTLLVKMGFTKTALDALVQQVVLKHWQSWVQPGQPVGVIAAHSIGEPSTQMTLNTFHLSGVAAKSNMTRGIPRLTELLKATKKPKAKELTIPLRRDLRDKKEEARRLAQDLEFTLLKDLVTVARIYYDPRDDATLVQEDADWLAYLAAFESVQESAGDVVQPSDPLSGAAGAAVEPSTTSKSPLVLRFELDRERMFAKDITMDDIAYVIRWWHEIDVLYTDYNSSRLVFRIRLAASSDNAYDDLQKLKMLQNKILTSTAVRGIPGLRSVNYVKSADNVELVNGEYKAVEQYVLVSDGSNFMDVISHPDVDATRVVSSDVHDMFDNLGIEAMRATLYKEVGTLFAEAGTSVNYRHLGLLLDAMCHRGIVMSVDRHGIYKNDIGPLAKMSFEQTEAVALRAAEFGERDPCLGVSAKVMLGAPIRAGTAFSEILLDEVSAVKLAESTPEQAVRLNAGPAPYDDEELSEMLYGGGAADEGPCAPAELRMKVAVPTAPLGVVEELDEELEIALID
jgi:DNA-directed RNA polymerase II subunit RPB1